MSRDFEFKQLLRAYRSGIISQATFEGEMTCLEGMPTASNGNGSSGGFKAFGRTYKSERDAVVSFLDKVRAGEAGGGEAFTAWAEVCTTDCIRSGLRMIAERENYHARIFENRLRELGAEARAKVSDEGRKIMECASDPNMADTAKLLQLNAALANPDELIRPIFEFADQIKEDLETKEALKLFAEDELSTAKWLKYACAALNAPAETNSMVMTQEI